MKRMAIAALTLLVFVVSCRRMPGQAPANTPVAASPTFAVTTVKPNTTGSQDASTEMSGGIFTATNVTLKRMIASRAYGISDARIFGGPKWMGSAKFDMQAKMESADAQRVKTLDRAHRRAMQQPMFQQMLADRFKLAVHWETREMPVYELVVGKKGSLLTPANPTEGGSGIDSDDNSLVATNVTLDELAQTLTQELQRDLGRVVVDKTGLSGRYDVKLKWTPEDDGTPGQQAADAPPTILTAIQEQLGLKLEPSKGPVKVLVIDHVEMPKGN
ncbi:TIGR03435 family protein [Granulicella sp. 5B5]|uniref:TIGR03435 family protein n=1 Tax=Granulicella sp. 5B5 TaxID=1617967 RepID=UPI0015F353E7|nr:TIGR03435 family protein [Granulicella sp. 5B5]